MPAAPAAPTAESDTAPSAVPRIQPELAELRPAALGAERSHYVWWMLPLATLVMISSSPGQTFGFSFFNPEFITALSISQTQLSATYLIATLVAAIPLSYVGALTDRWGLRRCLLATVGCMAAACCFAACVQNLTMLFITYAVMRMIGPGAMVLMANNTVAAWFDRRLGMASGAMQLGMAGAVAVMPVTALALIELLGWRQAYLVFAAFIGLGLWPLLWLGYRERPLGINSGGRVHRKTSVSVAGLRSDHAAVTAGPQMTLGEAARTHSFWILIAATGAWALIGTGLVFHMEAVFVGRGMSRSIAAWAPTLLAIGMASAQLIGGMLADRLAIRWLTVTSMTGIAAACLIITVSDGPQMLAAFGVYGAAQGVMTVIAGTAWARLFGRAHMGRIRGVVLTAAIAFSSAGPLILAASADYLGSFGPGLWAMAALAGAIGVAGLWVRG